MKVFFTSIDMHNEKMSFEVDGHYEENNTLVFPDMSSPNTFFYITAVDGGLVLIRSGNVNMDAYLKEGSITEGSYEGNGLGFKFTIYTQHLQVSKNKIALEYAMLVENELVGHNKITILLH